MELAVIIIHMIHNAYSIPKSEKVKERKEGIYCLLTPKIVCCTFVIMAHSLQAAYLKLMRIVGPAFRLSYVFILYSLVYSQWFTFCALFCAPCLTWST